MEPSIPRGLRYNAAKLLLAPYARAIHGEVRFGAEVVFRCVAPCRTQGVEWAAGGDEV